MSKIKKAVIPAAGLGTRFLPATKAMPKEMIPIIDTPMIQVIVEEAVRSGIETIVLVTARHKESIENHFDYSYEVEKTLEEKGKKELAEISKSVARFANIISVRQKNPMGLGHAVLMAEPVVGNEPFAVLLGDDLIISEKKQATKQLMDLFDEMGKSCVAVMEVPEKEISKYGIIAGTKSKEGFWTVTDVVEKPKVSQAPSRMAIPGRYVLIPEIFDHLKKVKPGTSGEIQLTDGLVLLAQNQGLLAHTFEGIRYDTGDRLGYIDATLAFALKRPDLREDTILLMKKYLEKN
ncbi:MAG: UTP--glucose-1-phosphate uridylyltransferase GalU [Xanthomonadaceae bacterium]|nr:UTP--glucose-1-phosphate uridylyltransferase GalU [Xanthomonadaceae bacterium]